MEALHSQNKPSPEEISSSAKEESIKAFENNLHEENLRLLRNLRIQEMIGKAKKNDPSLWPFK